ncbi:DUF6942 family protein [Thalassolituus oleivorans]|uniref:DUF6942 family protein n=1 Tax=Thalassolituus oleivorans TaxID=187493 RepID=UPI0023EFAF20|nr:hypothetical protein [Thalassolituus oleivorans]
MNDSNTVGLGDEKAHVRVYIANRPPLSDYLELAECRPMVIGEIARIAQETGNHWRKIFNVYAKLMAEYRSEAMTSTWQAWRDDVLLQQGSDTALLFSTVPDSNLGDTIPIEAIHLWMGKGFASENGFFAEQGSEWLDAHFAINRRKRWILCPYFDYRQLSNERIQRLAVLMKSFSV